MKNFNKIICAFMAKKKHFALLCALLCASMMGWATQYCHTEINSTNSNGSAYMTCCPTDNPNEYKILFEGTNARPLTSLNAQSVGFNNINGVIGGSTITFSFSAADNGSAEATFTCESTPSTPYVAYIVFGTANGEMVFNEFPKDMDWAECSGGGGSGGSEPEPEPEPTVTVASCRTLCNGYEYTYSNNASGAVTLVVTLDAALPGAAPAPNVYNDNNQSTAGSTSDGQVFTFNLGTFSEGAELKYRTYFPYTGAVYEKQWLTFIVGESCSDRDMSEPSITAASLVSKTSAQAVISVTATDNVGVTACAVYDGTAHLGDYAVAAGQITVTELMYNHAYTLTIKAKDGAGNVSNNSVNVEVATDDNTSIIDDSEAEAKDNWATESGTSATATSGTAANAIDGNEGSRWESASSDPQVWTLDMGAARVFDKIQIIWEGAYGKTFTLAISDDNSTWTTVYYVNGQVLADFPHTQTIDLPQLKARYIRFKGIERGTGYGYSFWEFKVIKSASPVLTTITAEIVNDKYYYTVGTDAATLSLGFKDQYNEDIAHGEVTYNISPDASYGSILNGVFTPAKSGHISITAQVGSVVSNAVSLWATSSSNLAYNRLHSASTGESVIDEKPAANAVDNNEGTDWQSHAGTADTEDARTYDTWLIVNLGDKYDIDLVAVKFEGACSQAYTIEFTDDLEHAWQTGASYSGSAGINAHRDEHSVLTNNTGVQYVRFFSTKAATQYGMKVQELRVFGTAAAAPTRSVSATVNDPAMGTATVKQSSVDVTEVETGSTVTFSAVANEGYAFVNWSNGETNATFNAEVNANMNLTANFRALGTTYCNTLVHSSNGGQEHDAYVTMKRTAENTYQIVVRAEYELGNFSNTEFRIKAVNAENTSNYNLINQGVLTNSNHVLTGTITSTIEPEMISGKLYVNIVGKYEGQFDRLTNIEYSIPCEDEVGATSISLNMSEATIEIGATKTLTVSFDPVYTADQSITWTTSNGSVASVDNGVVTANAIGTATITAESANGKTATCAVTVEAITTKTCWGEGNDFTYKDQTVSYDYSVTRNVDKTLTFYAEFSHDIAGLGNLNIVTPTDHWHLMAYNSTTKTASVTTEAPETYETDDVIHCFFYFEGRRTDFDYTVGAVCAKASVDVTEVEINHSSATLLVGETITLAASVIPANADDKEIIWENSDPSVASFNSETGVVTAVAEGTTTITAKSHFDQSISASCVVTVSESLTPITWHGVETFTANNNMIGVNYSITRTAERQIHYHIRLAEAVDGLGDVSVNDGDWHTMTKTENGRSLDWTTSGEPYEDGANVSFFFHLPYPGGVARWDIVYTVGSSNAEPNVMLPMNDNNSNKISEYNNVVADVVINRNILADDTWYTLCLPFDMSAEKVNEVFGASTIATLESSEDRGSVIHLNFNYVDAIQAGKPYLIKPGTSFTAGTTISNVTIKNVDPSAEGYKAEATHMHFEGTFDKITLTGDDKRYVSANNELYSPNPNGGSAIGAFRCYFTIPSGSSASAPGKQARIVFGPQQATGMDLINDSSKANGKLLINGVLYIIRDGNTYNAQGMLVK